MSERDKGEDVTLRMIAYVQWLMLQESDQRGISPLFLRLERIESYLFRRYNREEP